MAKASAFARPVPYGSEYLSRLRKGTKFELEVGRAFSGADQIRAPNFGAGADPGTRRLTRHAAFFVGGNAPRFRVVRTAYGDLPWLSKYVRDNTSPSSPIRMN